MDWLLFAWAAIVLLIVVYFAVVVLWGAFSVKRLSNVVAAPQVQWPKVSIIIPARNEERHIQQALRSTLQLDYPELEVIAVNDRSSDRTGEILEQLAASDARLRVVHVRELPSGWLGKNHALHTAAAMASGEFLFFTDADVIFEPAVLKLAIQYCQQHTVDHLAATMEVQVPGWLMKSFVLAFGLFFMAYFRPWRAANPATRTYIGIGAFNLVRSGVYRELGGHARIAMRPDDDVMLGKLIKMNRYRQDFVDAVSLMRVPWYGSLREMIRGLEKNQFSGVEYSIPVVVLSSLLALAAFVAPFIMVFLASGPARWLFAAAALVLWAVCLLSSIAVRLPLIAALAFPIAVLLFVFIQWRTMVMILVQGGLQWRDTFYSLAELKANRLDWPDGGPRNR